MASSETQFLFKMRAACVVKIKIDEHSLVWQFNFTCQHYFWVFLLIWVLIIRVMCTNRQTYLNTMVTYVALHSECWQDLMSPFLYFSLLSSFKDILYCWWEKSPVLIIVYICILWWDIVKCKYGWFFVSYGKNIPSPFVSESW